MLTKSSTSNTGIRGVSYHSKRKSFTAIKWKDGERMYEEFFCGVYGTDKAFKLACEARKRMDKEP
jgi:uncharacterized protein YjiK